MTRNMFKISIAISVIILFFGASLTANIGGYVGEIKVQSKKVNPMGGPLSNDYMIAYWKCDECSGSTLEDSSIYDHDGIVYGAGWISGQSGCALNFDGINDYVDISAHSGDFGFNKTDDLLYSFSFKTTSTDKGIIYSTCRGDSYGYNPGFHIALLPNGSIQVQVWRLNCGILISSGGSFNDGSWHQAEVLYNGLSAKPIIDIYVDGTLIYHYEKYICNFYSDQFKYTNIGRHSHDLADHFDRNIDEFKIFKYEGGNEQNPPTIDGPTYGAPGENYEYNFVAEDPEGDDIWYFVDWGDSSFEDWFGPFSSGTEVSVSHSWGNEGIYEIRAQTKDIWDDSRASDAHAVAIGNAPPDIPTISGPSSGGTGGIYGYNIVTTEPDGNDIYYYFDWDDGTNSGWDGPYPSGQEVTIYNLWSSPGTYTIKGKAKDIFNAESYWSEEIIITIVENDPPTTPTIQGPSNGKVGSPITYTFKSTDPDGDQVAYYIDWADGTQASWSNYYDSGETFTASHTWNSEGAFTINAKAKDAYNAESDWGTYTVTIPRYKINNYSLLLRFLDRFASIQEFFEILGRYN